jgi:hypothetical protein
LEGTRDLESTLYLILNTKDILTLLIPSNFLASELDLNVVTFSLSFKTIGKFAHVPLRGVNHVGLAKIKLFI